MAEPAIHKDEWGDTGQIVFTYYWADWSEFAADGVFEVKTSWYTEDGPHMTGFTKVAPGEPDL